MEGSTVSMVDRDDGIFGYLGECNIPGCEARNRGETGMCIASMHRKSGEFSRFKS
jgi:hypothetical protein